MAEGGTGKEDVVVRFGASVDDVTSKLGQVGQVFDGVSKKFAAMAAVVAGGAAFKSFIDEALRINAEASKLSKTLGITGEEAATLNTALGDIGSDSDAYSAAFLKFTRSLRTGGDELKALGVDVDALRSGQKDSNQVFQESLKIVGAYRAGVDQAQVAMKLFGRNVDDVRKLMRLNNELLEEARKKNEELNLGVSQEGVAAAKRYKAAMNDVGDVLSGFKKTVGEAVLPLFSEMAERLSSSGPAIVEGTRAATAAFVGLWRTAQQAASAVWEAISAAALALSTAWTAAFGGESLTAMDVFKNALRLVSATAIGLRVVVEELANSGTASVKLLAGTLVTFGTVAERVFARDWAGARAAWSAGLAGQRQVLSDAVEKAKAIAVKGGQDIQDALTAPEAKAARTPVGKPEGGDKKADLGEDQAKAAAVLSLEKARRDASLALQQEYLREEQAISDEAFRNDLVSLKKYYDDRLDVELAGIDLSIAAKRKEAEEAAAQAARLGRVGKESERIGALAKEAGLLGEVAVMEARRAEAVRASGAAFAEAEKKRLDALASVRAERDNAREQDAVSEERARIGQMQALRQVDADQAFALQRAAEERSYAATQKFVEAKRALLREGDLQGQAALNAQAEAEERQHQARMSQIARAAELERAQASLQAQQGVQQGFAQMTSALLSGTTKIKDAVRGFGLSVATTFQNLIAQRFAEKLFGAGSAGGDLIDAVTQPLISAVDTIVKKWILGQSAMTSATVAGTAARTTAEEAAAGESLILMAATAIKRIAIAAWVAAAEVYQALASIPYVGPFLAPAAAIAAVATVIGFGKNIASAEGGWWEIPSDQIAQVHKNEMVLPAKAAQGVRDLVEGGGRAGGAGGGITINVAALDGHSVKRVLMDNPAALAAAVRNAGRDGMK